MLTFSESTLFHHPDWVATEHWITTNTGTSYGHCVNDPFGDQLYCGTAEGELSPVHFTGKERDWANQPSPTNLDNFGARYYSSATARFMTPDWAAKPAAVPYANYGNPQSLNLYAYVENNPTTTADLDGHQCQLPTACAPDQRGVPKVKPDKVGCEMNPSVCPNATTAGASQSPDQKDANQKAQHSSWWTLKHEAALVKLVADAGMFASIFYPQERAAAVDGEVEAAQLEMQAEAETEIVAANGTKVTGYSSHGVDRAIGDGAGRAGAKPDAILDALKNPQRITTGVDEQGRPFQVFAGRNARVVVNPQTGKIVSVNPLSQAGVR